MTTFSGTFYEDQLCALKKMAKNSLNMVPKHRVKLWSYVLTTIRGIITRITTVLLLAHLATPATAHIRQLVGTKQNVLLPETGTIISYVSTLTGQIQKHVCYIQCCGYGSESSSGSNLFYYPAQNCQLILIPHPSSSLSSSVARVGFKNNWHMWLIVWSCKWFLQFISFYKKYFVTVYFSF